MDQSRSHIFARNNPNLLGAERRACLINKMNNTGTKFNLRIIHVNSIGLFYYTNIPENWKDNDYESLREPPKAGVLFDKVTSIIDPPMDYKRKKLFFSVEFDSNDLLHFKRGKNLFNPLFIDDPQRIVNFLQIKSKEEARKPRTVVKWMFSIEGVKGLTLRDAEIKQTDLLRIINYNRDRRARNYDITTQNNDYEKKNDDYIEKAMMEQASEQPKREEDMTEQEKRKYEEEEKMKRLMEEKVRREQELKRKKEEEEQKRKEEEKRREDEEKRKKEENEQRERNKRRELEAKKQFEEKRAKVESDIEFRFFQITEENISTLHNFDENMKRGLKLFHYLGVFKNKATEIVKTIIDGLSLPIHLRQHDPEIIKDEFGVVREHIYSLNNPNMHVRLAWSLYTKTQTEEVNMLASIKEENYFYDDKRVKALGHEFRAMNLLNDILFSLRKQNEEYLFRVPIAIMVDYKGIRALVTSQPPISLKDESTLVLGPTQDGSYKFNQTLSVWLKKIAEMLNLKPHRFEWDQSKNSFQVMLSVFFEVHKPLPNKWNDLRDMLLNAPEPVIDPKKYETYYLNKVGDIFPVDVDVDSREVTSFIRRLRPEFLLNYPKPLSADAFTMAVESPESELDDVEVAEAGRKLREVELPAFLNKLERLELLPIDSRSISEAFHNYGVNIRFLGWISSNTVLPHIREICQIEMAARSCKKIFNHHISEIALNFNNQESQDRNSNSPSKKGEDRRSKLGGGSKNIQNLLSGKDQAPSSQFLAKLNDELIECTLDYLNLIFGSGEECELYWSQILCKQVEIDFGYKLNKKEIILGGLLHAISYHCSLDLDFTSKIPLGREQLPFKREQVKGVKKKVRGFGFKSVEIKLLSEKYAIYREQKNYKLCEKAMNIKQSIDKASDNLSNVDSNYILEVSQFLLDSNRKEEAIAKAMSILETRHPQHADTSRAWTIIMKAYLKIDNLEKALEAFDNSLAILEFHLGPFHPHHATIYSILGYHYAERKKFEDAILLYKSSLVCCNRILGSNHLTTGQVLLDLANLYNKLNQKDEALWFYERAHSVFDIFKNENPNQYAAICMQIAQIMKLQGKMVDAIDFAKKSILTLESEESKNSDKLIEGCSFISDCADLINAKELSLEYAENTWYYISKSKNIGWDEQKEKAIRTGLTIILHALDREQKHLLYRLFDCIKEALVKEKRGAVYQRENISVEQLKKALRYFENESSETDGLGNFISSILTILLNNTKEFYKINFFLDYRLGLLKLMDEELRRAILNYENLVHLLGMSFFHENIKC